MTNAPASATQSAVSVRTRTIWVAAASLALAVGLLLLVLGISPWIAPVAVVCVLTLAIAQRTSWAFAFAAAMVVELALIAALLRIAPVVGIGLVPATSLLLALVGGSALLFVARSAHRFLTAREMRVVVPGTLAILILVVGADLRGTLTGDLEWAMHNDAVWNTVTARVMIEQGGINDLNPNASPLTPGIMAIAASVGRSSVAAMDLLAHDVGRVAGFWLVTVAAAAVLAALIGSRSAAGGSRTARIIAAIVAGALPFTWFFWGFASYFGFYNAALTLLVLLASWVAWLEVRTAPVLSVAVLSLAAVAALATWAPVAVVPVAFAAWALLWLVRTRGRALLALRQMGVLALALIPVPVYVLAVTLSDLSRDGAALAVDGGIMSLTPVHVLVIGVTTVAVMALAALHRGQGHAFFGGILVAGAGAIGCGYLVWQRVSAGASLWGYYPAKFSWLLVSLLLVLLAATLLGELAALRRHAVRGAGVVLLTVAVLASLMAQLSPRSVGGVFTPVDIFAGSGVAEGSPAAQELFELAEPGERTLALSYHDESVDAFVNSWLLQLESTSAQDPIRAYAFLLTPGDEQQACDAVRVWGSPVRVVTSDPTLEERFLSLCAGADVTVDVREP